MGLSIEAEGQREKAQRVYSNMIVAIVLLIARLYGGTKCTALSILIYPGEDSCVDGPQAWQAAKP